MNDLTRGRVDDAQVDGHIRVLLVTADREAMEVQSAAASGGVLLIRGNGAHHEVLRPGELADFRGGPFGHATGRSEILFV